MIANIEIVDPIELSKTGGIEVVVKLEDGKERWCFFLTPEGASSCGYWITGTKVRFHYGAPHMIVVSEISEEIIRAALKDIENQGLIESCTKLI